MLVNRILEYLSGTMPVGVIPYLVALVVVWLVWIFTSRHMDYLSTPIFWKWGIIFSVIIIGIYLVFRVQYSPPPSPQRWWIQPFAADDDLREKADLARFSLETSLETLNNKAVAFHSKRFKAEMLCPLTAEPSQPPPAGALLIQAQFAVIGRFLTGKNNYILEITLYHLNWRGTTEEVHSFAVSADDPATVGYRAAVHLLEKLELESGVRSKFRQFDPRVMTALFDADRTADLLEKEAILFNGFPSPDSNKVQLWEALADLYLDWNYPSYKIDAEYAMSRALSLDNKSSTALYVRGMIAWRMGGHLEEAIANWKLAHLYDYRHTSTLLALSRLQPRQLRDLRFGDRRIVLKYALSLRPTDPEPRKELAKYYREGKAFLTRAERLIDEGLALNPDDPTLIMSHGVMSIEKSDWISAEADFSKLIEQDSTRANAWYNLGIVKRGLKEKEAAAHAFQKAITYNGPPDAHYYLGVVYESMGEIDKALEQYQLRWNLRHSDVNDFGTLATRERMRKLLWERRKAQRSVPDTSDLN